MAKPTKPCGIPLTKDRYDLPDTDGPLCLYHRSPGRVKCRWHDLLKMPIERQVSDAQARLALAPQPHRQRVPADLWPAGERWCSGCQHMVPTFYVQGSRCRGCQSAAAHAGHVERTYGITGEQYQRLLDWQGGRCYICRQVPRVRRLAVDHDHRTGRVRGLLCANDEWGCNKTLAKLLNDPELARRALEYALTPPLEQMLAGTEPVVVVSKQRVPTGWDDWDGK